MIGDAIVIRPEYMRTAEAIWERLLAQRLPLPGGRTVLAIGGESGSGKSVAAMCLQRVSVNHGFPAAVLHQDDYFRKPPKANHAHRLAHPEWVGPQEVRMDLLQANIDAYREGADRIDKPLVNFRTDEILLESLRLDGHPLLIVEGTYVMELERTDARVFIDRTFRDTRKQRLERRRDPDDPFIERVLGIEHALIVPGRKRAQILLTRDYTVIDGPAPWTDSL